MTTIQNITDNIKAVLRKNFTPTEQQTIVKKLQTDEDSIDVQYVAAVLFPELSAPTRVPKNSWASTALLRQKFTCYVTLGHKGEFIWGFMPLSITEPCFFTINEYICDVNPALRKFENKDEKSFMLYPQTYDSFLSKNSKQARVVSAVIKLQYIGIEDSEQGIAVCGHTQNYYPTQLNVENIEDSDNKMTSKLEDGIRMTWLPSGPYDCDFFSTKYVISPYMHTQVGDEMVDILLDGDNGFLQKWTYANKQGWGIQNRIPPEDVLIDRGGIIISPVLYRGMTEVITGDDGQQYQIGLVYNDTEKYVKGIQNSFRPSQTVDIQNKWGVGGDQNQGKKTIKKPSIMCGYYKGLPGRDLGIEQGGLLLDWIRVDIERVVEYIPTTTKGTTTEIPQQNNHALGFIKRPEIRNHFKTQTFGRESTPLKQQKLKMFQQPGLTHLQYLEKKQGILYDEYTSNPIKMIKNFGENHPKVFGHYEITEQQVNDVLDNLNFN